MTDVVEKLWPLPEKVLLCAQGDPSVGSFEANLIEEVRPGSAADHVLRDMITRLGLIIPQQTQNVLSERCLRWEDAGGESHRRPYRDYGADIWETSFEGVLDVIRRSLAYIATPPKGCFTVWRRLPTVTRKTNWRDGELARPPIYRVKMRLTNVAPLEAFPHIRDPGVLPPDENTTLGDRYPSHARIWKVWEHMLDAKPAERVGPYLWEIAEGAPMPIMRMSDHR